MQIIHILLQVFIFLKSYTYIRGFVLSKVKALKDTVV